MPRFFVDLALKDGERLPLPAGASRHVQVLRLQPGDKVTLFNGTGGQWRARIDRIERTRVTVELEAFEPIEREPTRSVHLAVGVPANERMDWLVEKASELGAASLQPLMTAHSVLRLSGERAEKKRRHWQAVAAAACEQCGGNRLPDVAPVRELPNWLGSLSTSYRLGVLSLQADSRPLAAWRDEGAPEAPLMLLSGPEGGLSPMEEEMARAVGFVPISLGTRVLRAETAALTALSLALQV